MKRDLEKHKRSQELHYLWQIEYFAVILKKRIERGLEWFERGYPDKAKQVFEMAAQMRFQYTDDAFINYGDCEKFKKEVSFIPGILQLDTQECFQHRRQ